MRTKGLVQHASSASTEILYQIDEAQSAARVPLLFEVSLYSALHRLTVRRFAEFGAWDVYSENNRTLPIPCKIWRLVRPLQLSELNSNSSPGGPMTKSSYIAISFLLALAFGVVSSVGNADDKFQLSSDSSKATQVRAALASVGNVSAEQVDGLVNADNVKESLLGMIDPLVHRQGSDKPFESALPGPGFKSFGALIKVLSSNPNAKLLPQMSTKFWSKELKQVLIPQIMLARMGIKKGDDYILTACNIADLLMQIRTPGAPAPAPLPGFSGQQVSSPSLTSDQWLELRDQIGELAVRYNQAIQTGTFPGQTTSPNAHQ